MKARDLEFLGHHKQGSNNACNYFHNLLIGFRVRDAKAKALVMSAANTCLFAARKFTGEVGYNDRPTDSIVIEAKIEQIGQMDRERLLGFDDGQGKVCHCQLTSYSQGVEGKKGTVPQPQLDIRWLCNLL